MTLTPDIPEFSCLCGMVSWVGFQQTSIQYHRDKCFAGTPAYSWRTMIHLATDTIVSLSPLPLRLILFLGLAITGFAFGGGMVTIFLNLPPRQNREEERIWCASLG